jgi:4-hydroxy-tetrahydrodipicolinate reductase
MNIALVGYGKMGKMIESVAKEYGYNIQGIYDIDKPMQSNFSKDIDLAIEFSTPKSVIENIEFLASNGINIVCGTTGWYDKTEYIKELVNKYNIGFIYASNFSLGVNIFFQIIKYASKLINSYPQYNIQIEETHHTQKLDKPSGTAIRIAEYIIENIEWKKTYINDEININDEQINIISKRISDVVGKHTVDFESKADIISLTHNAKSRRGFAEGALLAAKFIINKKGFYKFENIFHQLI